MKESDLTQPSPADLQGAASPEELARREGWSPERYAVALAENIRRTDVPLDAQRERLAALAACGGAADKASADALAQHYALLEALMQRFSYEALQALNRGGPHGPTTSTTYLAASLKAQRAALSVLSALKVLREAQLGGVGGGAGAPTTAAAAAAAGSVKMVKASPAPASPDNGSGDGRPH